MVQGEKIIHEDAGAVPDVTHIRMELWAVIAALKTIAPTQHAIVYSDSEYVVDAINKDRLARWRANDFKTKRGMRAHADLWQELSTLLGHRNVRFVHVPAHSDITFNQYVDRRARAVARELTS